MIDIPGPLQCSYCIRNYTHGGECRNPYVKSSEGGCLAFKLDSKGCIRENDFRIEFPLYYEIPPLNAWVNDWTINGADTEICITQIHGIKWDTKKGFLILHCRCKYYINEYDEGYKEPDKKSNLKLIK
jgi:hypothetical protein